MKISSMLIATRLRRTLQHPVIAYHGCGKRQEDNPQQKEQIQARGRSKRSSGAGDERANVHALFLPTAWISPGVF